MFSFDNIKKQLLSYGKDGPFDHCCIDNFLEQGVAQQLFDEFPTFSSADWHEYENPLEIKKTCNNWNLFPSVTYSVFEKLNSQDFVNFLEDATGIARLYSDPGLNGGGWHIHRSGGKLNTHLDYSIHPKLGRQRILNIIIYLTPQWSSSWGGGLGLWHPHKTKNGPGKLAKTIEPLFNRAVIFNTTQQSWHGLPDPITCPENVCRRSIAAYYLTDAAENSSDHKRAIFSPTASQESDKDILEVIRKRSSLTEAKHVYRQK